MTETNSLPRPTLLGAVIRHWRLVAVVVLTGALVGGLGSLARASKPGATAILVVRDPRPGLTSDGTAAARYAAEQAALIPSELVLASTRKLLLQAKPPINLSLRELGDRLSVSGSPSGNVLNVTVSDASGVRAAYIANAVVQAYRAVTRSQVERDASAQLKRIDASIAVLQRSITGSGNSPAAELARDERSGLLALRASVSGELTAGDGVTASSPATTPTKASAKGALLRGAGLGATVGFLVGALIAYLIAGRRRRCGRRDDPELMLAAPCLGPLHVGRTAPARGDAGGPAAGTELLTTTGNLLSRLALKNAWSVGFVRDAHDPEALEALLDVATAASRMGRRVLVLVAPSEVLTESAQRALGDAGARAIPSGEPADSTWPLVPLVSTPAGQQAGNHRPRADSELAADRPRSGSPVRRRRPSTPRRRSTSLALRSVAVGDGSQIHIALAEPATAEAYLGQPDALARGRGVFDLALVDIGALSDGREALLSPLVDANVVLVRHNSLATVTERLAQGLSLAGASVVGYLYLQAARHRRSRSEPLTVAAWLEETASTGARHGELVHNN